MSRSLALASATICLLSFPTRALDQAAATQSLVVSGATEIIAVSESGKTLYGYSVKTGTWEGLAIANPDNVHLNPILGNGVGCVAIARSVHAFSPATGHWATLELPEAAQPALYPGHIRVKLGTKIHVFSAVTGTWATVDLAVDKK